MYTCFPQGSPILCFGDCSSNRNSRTLWLSTRFSINRNFSFLRGLRAMSTAGSDFCASAVCPFATGCASGAPFAGTASTKRHLELQCTDSHVITSNSFMFAAQDFHAWESNTWCNMALSLLTTTWQRSGSLTCNWAIGIVNVSLNDARSIRRDAEIAHRSIDK